MARDLLQISLEHHRAGRLRRAEEGYRLVLAEDAKNAEAMQWLGILYTQAGQLSEAIPLLEKSAELRPGDAAGHYNLGQAYLAAGRIDDAISALRQATDADPHNGENRVAVARLQLSRREKGDAEAALATLRQAALEGFDTADLHHYTAVALLAAKQFREAIDACKKSLAKKADDANVLYYQGLAHRGLGEFKETRKCLNKALEIEPALAAAWCGLAVLDSQSGKWAEAAGLYRRAIACKRGYVEAYRGLAQALLASGKRDEARVASEQADRAARGEMPTAEIAPVRPASVADLEKHLTPTEDNTKAHFALAALANVFPPASVPAGTLQSFFDKYAPKFDQHLQGTLKYRVPEQIATLLREIWSGKPLDILDLGCGTGLCGPLLRPFAASLTGVDLSPAMIEKTRERGVYDQLHVGELVQLLQACENSYDLLVAADVLIYLGDLSSTFEAAAAALRVDGIFAFSLEAGPGNRYELSLQTRRFMHAESYIKHLVRIHGFEEVRFDSIEIRQESEKSVPGYLVVVRKPAE